VKPNYELDSCMRGCATGLSNATVLKIAMDTARTDFNLNTQIQVLGFIGNGGLENPCFINSKPWENNPHPHNGIMVDAYSFYSGSLYGYFAFFQSTTGKWVIKSFKKNRNTDPRNFAIRDELSKLIIQH